VSVKRIGIFGGTFNPPHLGHLILAETALEEINLDRVFFVPAASPPHKTNKPLASATHRMAMVQLATMNNQRFVVSSVDMDRPGPHYTNDMIEIFKGHYPNAEFYFLMGSDSLRDLLSWKDPDVLIELTKLAVMQRPSIYPDLSALTRELPGLLEQVYFLDAPEIEISSTEIVRMLKSQKSVRYRVPASVLRYLKEHKLYAPQS
jgi:nicotinate-nucleotide adenylyltransferase